VKPLDPNPSLTDKKEVRTFYKKPEKYSPKLSRPNKSKESLTPGRGLGAMVN
jgi:hypothetical protein